MQCAAVAIRSGSRCRRAAIPGTRYCMYHHRNRIADAKEASVSPASVSLLPAVLPVQEDGAEKIGVEDEIAMLRRQIREADQIGDAEASRRGTETLLKALKVQHVLAGRSTENLADSLARALEEIGTELANSD